MRTLRPGVVTIFGVVLLWGCGSGHHSPAPACTGEAKTIEAAAIAASALADGTKLSDCVANARSDADLQAVAVAFTTAGDELALRAKTDPAAARGLGFLIGAGRRGATHSAGNAIELSRRLGADQRRVHETAPSQDFVVVRGITDGQTRG
jgi:hypothetical protein